MRLTGLRFLRVGLEISKFQTYSRQHLLVVEKPLQQSLPVGDGAMFQHKFERDVFQEQVLGRANDCDRRFFSALVMGLAYFRRQ